MGSGEQNASARESWVPARASLGRDDNVRNISVSKFIQFERCSPSYETALRASLE